MPATILLAIGATAVWFAAVGAVYLRGRGRRDRTAPGPTPTAVQALLTAPERREDPRVLDAAALELAARRVIEIIPADSQAPAMIRPAVIPAERLLPEYHDLLLARVRHRSGPRGAPIPFTALRADDDREALAWRHHFGEAVRHEAAARGLMQSPIRPAFRRVLILSSLLPSTLIFLALRQNTKAGTPTALLAFLLAEILAVGVSMSAVRTRVTRLGHAELAAAYPAQSATVPAEAPVHQSRDRRVLPEQLSPLPAHQIWSHYNGSWHPLDLRSHEVYSDSGARSAMSGVAFVALFCAGSQLVQIAHTHHVSPLTAAVFLGLPLLALAAVAVRTALRRKLPKHLVLQGKIARLWSVQDSDPRANRPASRSPSKYYCVLDVGRAPQSVRLNLAPRRYQTLRVGDIVEVAVRPRRGRIAGLRNLGEDF